MLALTVATFLILILSEVTYVQGQQLEFGDECRNATASFGNCNVAKHLVCSNVTNACECSDPLFFNDTRGSAGQCTAYAGHPCTESGYPIGCIANSWCKIPSPGEPGICQCNADFMKTPGGKCLMSYDVSGCNEDNDCNQYAFLKCSYGTCICQLNNRTYDQQHWDNNGDESTCRSFVGADCTRGLECVKNAQCHNNRTCSCDRGFVNTDGYCLKELGQSCTEHSECSSNNCNSNTPQGVCSCPQGQIQVGNRCYVLPGQSCALNTTCVDNANCLPSQICQCNDGYSPAGDTSEKCLGRFNTSCSGTNDICDGGAHLICGNDGGGGSRCICATGYKYNALLDKCEAQFGTSCTINSDCIFSTTCVNITANVRTCQCQPGLVKGDREDVCRAKYGEDCDLYGCYNFNYHVCNTTSKICDCESEDLYPNNVGSCVGKVDTPCNTGDVPRPLYCVDNASCLPGETDTSTTCKCLEGFHGSENKTMCLVGNGSGVLTVSIIFISIFFIFSRCF